MNNVVILDFDNTMFNNGLALAHLTAKILLEFEIQCPISTIIKYIGKTTEEHMFIHGLHGSRLKESVKMFKRFHSKLLAVNLCEMIPGLEEFLKQCKYVKIIISLSPASNIQKVLVLNGLINFIDKVFSVQDLGYSNKTEFSNNITFNWSSTQFIIGDSADDREVADLLDKPFFCLRANRSASTFCEKHINFRSYYYIIEYLKGASNGQYNNTNSRSLRIFK